MKDCSIIRSMPIVGVYLEVENSNHDVEKKLQFFCLNSKFYDEVNKEHLELVQQALIKLAIVSAYSLIPLSTVHKPKDLPLSFIKKVKKLKGYQETINEMIRSGLITEVVTVEPKILDLNTTKFKKVGYYTRGGEEEDLKFSLN